MVELYNKGQTGFKLVNDVIKFVIGEACFFLFKKNLIGKML